MKQFLAKIKLSGFDLGMIIAFAVVTVAGGAAWWYLSGVLAGAQADVTTAKADFDKYSSNPQFHVVVSPGNAKTLQTNIDLIKTQLVPVIQTVFRSKDNKLSLVRQEDPVAWKHDLDDEVLRLNTAAKTKSVVVPPNYYFGFSRYLNQSPSDEQTAVLTKQLLGIEEITNILIGAQVKGIASIRRTYEEDPHAAQGQSGAATEGDRLAGYALSGPGGAYKAYPFEIVFDTDSEHYRRVIDGLVQSPYVFVVRSLSVKNSAPNSPMLNDLDRMAGTPPSSVIGTSPGEVAATTSTVGPQYLFGNSTLTVTARVDMIEWTADVSAMATTAPGAGQNGQPKRGSP
jgi:hypothetical protein